MADVFISHQQEDRALASALDEVLRDAGFTTWWDTSLTAGDSWDEKIRRELEAARCVVVLWSHAAWASKWVQAEALDGHRREILVMGLLEDIALKVPFNTIQAADLRGWRGARDHSGVKAVMQGIDARLERDKPDIAPPQMSEENSAAAARTHAFSKPTPLSELKRKMPDILIGISVVFYGLMILLCCAWILSPSRSIVVLSSHLRATLSVEFLFFLLIISNSARLPVASASPTSHLGGPFSHLIISLVRGCLAVFGTVILLISLAFVVTAPPSVARQLASAYFAYPQIIGLAFIFLPFLLCLNFLLSNLFSKPSISRTKAFGIFAPTTIAIILAIIWAS